MTQIVEDELIAQKRQKTQKKESKACALSDVRHVYPCEPEAKFSASHDVAIILHAPPSTPVIHPRRVSRVVRTKFEQHVD
jgi:hypothetical protein